MGWYGLVNIRKMEAMAIESSWIYDLPMKNGGSFHGYVNVYQGVKLKITYRYCKTLDLVFQVLKYRRARSNNDFLASERILGYPILHPISHI